MSAEQIKKRLEQCLTTKLRIDENSGKEDSYLIIDGHGGTYAEVYGVDHAELFANAPTDLAYLLEQNKNLMEELKSYKGAE